MRAQPNAGAQLTGEQTENGEGGAGGVGVRTAEGCRAWFRRLKTLPGTEMDGIGGARGHDGSNLEVRASSTSPPD